ncbi:MAG TPA: CehA/McbA family metallohydrolase [Pyrinomonadaceae bacterium]
MRRKIIIILLALIILSQVPFAYRRYRLSRLRNTIQQLAAQRVTHENAGSYADYQGVIHVHTSLGGHSTGTFSELIAGAKANQLDFVIMTEHPQGEFDTAAMTLTGVHNGVLFVNGSEVSTANGDRLLLIPGFANAAQTGSQTTQEIIDQQKANGGLAIAAYPGESQNWQSTSVNGVEVYNLFTNTRQINKLATFFDGLWSYRGFPDLMFANFFVRPDENLKRWDETIAKSGRKLIAIGGNDAHSNVGLGLADATGKQLLGVKLDPYERSFRTVRTHVLIKKDQPLTRDSLLEAISLGHCYVSFDIFSAATGFSFSVNRADKIMGDEIYASGETELLAMAPLASRFVLYKNGSAVDQKNGTTAQFPVTGAAVYRVEVYLDSLPAPVRGQPWIISNPIYVTDGHERP